VVGIAALDEILTGMTEGSAAEVLSATGASMAEALTAEVLMVAALRMVRRASAAVTGSAAMEDFMAAAEGSTEVAWPTVAVDSTAVEVEGSTAVVADMAAVDTGNRKLTWSSLVR
jgi:hypothetical protein